MMSVQMVSGKNLRFLWIVLLISAYTSVLRAAPIEEYFFEPDIPYTVRTGLGVVTQIELSPKEKIKDFGTGLSNGWDLVRRENVFYLKPKDVSVDTNLIIRTQAHQYIFELKVVATNWKTLADAKDQGVQYHIKFRYPENTNFNVTSTAKSGYGVGYDPAKTYHANYDVAANAESQWLVPARVYDDGSFTYIHLGTGRFSGGFPAVYGRKTINGQEFVLNSNVDNNSKNVIVVHGTYPFLILRHGKNVVGLRRN